MKKKLYKIMNRDELILHKVGLVFGVVLGIVGGLFISERATMYQEIVEEVVDAETGSE